MIFIMYFWSGYEIKTVAVTYNKIKILLMAGLMAEQC